MVKAYLLKCIILKSNSVPVLLLLNLHMYSSKAAHISHTAVTSHTSDPIGRLLYMRCEPYTGHMMPHVFKHPSRLYFSSLKLTHEIHK